MFYLEYNVTQKQFHYEITNTKRKDWIRISEKEDAYKLQSFTDYITKKYPDKISIETIIEEYELFSESYEHNTN